MKIPYKRLTLVLFHLVAMTTTAMAQPHVKMEQWAMDETFPWLKSGRIVVYQSNIARTGKVRLTVFEPSTHPYSISLTGSVSGVNEVLAEGDLLRAGEIDIGKCVFDLALVAFGQPGVRALNATYLADYTANVGDGEGGETTRILQKFAREVSWKSDGRSWTLSAAVISSRMDIEIWTLSGRLDPLSITSFDMQPVQTGRSLKKLITY